MWNGEKLDAARWALSQMLNQKFLDFLAMELDSHGRPRNEVCGLSEWKGWCERNGILENPADPDEYVSLNWVGHIGGRALHVPKGFAQRALILGFLP